MIDPSRVRVSVPLEPFSAGFASDVVGGGACAGRADI